MTDIIKKYIPAIILLFIIVIVWAGIAFFLDSQSSYSEVDLEIYNSPMQNSFSQEELDDVDKRTLRTLPISPKEFTNLIKSTN